MTCEPFATMFARIPSEKIQKVFPRDRGIPPVANGSKKGAAVIFIRRSTCRSINQTRSRRWAGASQIFGGGMARHRRDQGRMR